jgi:hypothetical protein
MTVDIPERFPGFNDSDGTCSLNPWAASQAYYLWLLIPLLPALIKLECKRRFSRRSRKTSTQSAS